MTFAVKAEAKNVLHFKEIFREIVRERIRESENLKMSFSIFRENEGWQQSNNVTPNSRNFRQNFEEFLAFRNCM